MKEPVWEGVYPSFRGVPATGAAFDGETWISRSLAEMEKIRRAAMDRKTTPSVCGFRESVAPVVAATAGIGKNRVTVLDFGGGMGRLYYETRVALPGKLGLKFHVVEKEAVAKAGAEFFADEPDVKFHTVIPGDIGAVDIVHLGSSLHYIENWRGLLGELSSLGAPFFLIEDLPAGDIETFATLQRYYTSRIPVWFFNTAEVIGEMEKNGYRLVFKSSYIARIHGEERPMPQDNFEPERRIGHSCNLLFARANP
ncbi:MAG: methyltransferase, TIGR04325 family [Candidatus Nitrospinota bacterium M3_3B_026]